MPNPNNPLTKLSAPLGLQLARDKQNGMTMRQLRQKYGLSDMSIYRYYDDNKHLLNVEAVLYNHEDRITSLETPSALPPHVRAYPATSEGFDEAFDEIMEGDSYYTGPYLVQGHWLLMTADQGYEYMKKINRHPASNSKN